MQRECRLSNVTKAYLSRFHCILDEMIEGMTTAELTSSISHNFIFQMIPHHRAAIEMSENILQYTTLIPLQEIAENIITEQTKSIEDMCDIARECSKNTDPRRDVCLYQSRVDQILRTMFSGMRDAAATNNVNADFMREMIPHHRGAIEMSRNALQYDICRGLHPILDAIISSQEKGIAQMRQLLKLSLIHI